MNNYNPKRPRPSAASEDAAQVDGLLGPTPEQVIDVPDTQTQAHQHEDATQPVAEDVEESVEEVARPREHHLEVVSDMDLPTAGQVAVAEPPKGKIIAAIVASGVGVTATALAIWWWFTKRQHND